MRGPLQDKTRAFSWERRVQASQTPALRSPRPQLPGPRAPGAGPARLQNRWPKRPNRRSPRSPTWTGNGQLRPGAGGQTRSPRRTAQAWPAPWPPPTPRAPCAPQPRGRRGGDRYLQSLQPRVVAVHQPGPPWGHGHGQHGPSPQPSSPPTPASRAWVRSRSGRHLPGWAEPPEATPGVPTFQLPLRLLEPKLRVAFEDSAREKEQSHGRPRPPARLGVDPGRPARCPTAAG